MRCFRIADARFPIFDPTGAKLFGARWNSPGSEMIYTSETYSGALLEILVHTAENRLPRQQSFIKIQIPEHISVETLTPLHFPEWQLQATSRHFGDRWLAELRTVALLVPSVVTQGRERNLLINPAHPDFSAITHTSPEPVLWDQRLFSQ